MYSEIRRKNAALKKNIKAGRPTGPIRSRKELCISLMKGYMSRYKFLPSFYEQLVSSCFSFLSWYLVTCSLLNINTRKVCCLSSEDITVQIDQIDGRNWFNLCRRCVLRLNGCYVASFNIPADYNLPFALELLK
jgi:hypothetical protein